MDGTRFDDVARALTTTRTRRQSLRAARREVVRCPFDAASFTGFDVGGRHAQTFKAPASGRLSEVTVRIDHPQTSSGDYVAQIVAVDAAGVPDAERVLAEKTLPESGFSLGMQPVTFAFRPASGLGRETGLRRLLVSGNGQHHARTVAVAVTDLTASGRCSRDSAGAATLLAQNHLSPRGTNATSRRP